MIQKNSLKTTVRIQPDTLLLRVVVPVQLSSGCSAVEVIVAVFFKEVVVWKVWSSCGSSGPPLDVQWWCWCPKSPNCPDYIWWSSGGTTLRAGSFTVEWCNPMSQRIFLESLMIIPAAFPAGAYSVPYGPIAETPPSGWVGMCCCFSGGSYQGWVIGVNKKKH